MMNLPSQTEINKTIPKSNFYSKMNIATSVKNEFVNCIDKIIWKNKLSEDTIGISKTDEVEEIHVFDIILKNKNIPKAAIKSILKAIAYPALVRLKYENDVCYAIGLYEEKKNQNILFSDWNEKIEFNFSGLNLKNIYEKIVKSIIKENDNNESLNLIIETNSKINFLEKEIRQLQNKIKNEKQFNKKSELNKLLNDNIKELEEIKNE